MKRLFLLLALCGMVAVGCTEGGVDDNINNGGNEDESDIPENIFFGLDKESATFSPDGGSVDVTVYSNYKWEISGTSDWCTPSVKSGSANEDAQKVTFSADVAYDDREATFWFRCADEKIKFVVSQKLKESIIPDENNTFEISAEGGIAVINYQTSVECEVVIPEEAKSWISLAPATRALVSESINLDVAENTTYRERSAVVKVVKVGDNTLFAEYTITQNHGYFMEYTSEDGYTVRPYDSSAFDATIIRNEYIDGKGYIEFDAPITSIGSYAFYDCNSLTSVTIPDGVTSIGNDAFYNCNSLTSVAIGNSVTSIGDSAFWYCLSLTSITIPDGVTSIGDGAFCSCDSLTSVTIPDSVTSIGDGAFSGCSGLKSFKGKYASSDGRCLIKDGELISFAPCGLPQYTIPNSVTSIGDWAFYNCYSLTSVTIPDSVTSIGGRAFYYCNSLTSITIPDSVTSIGSVAFGHCNSLTSITIPDSVTSIGSVAFGHCTSLTSVTIPDSVTSIGYSAFYGCTSLTSVTIPDSVTSIGNWAFYDCVSLKKVYCKPTTPPTGGSEMFESNASYRKIYVPRNSVSAYMSASKWSSYASAIVGYDF
ncbi:MAG: leucine-rich repeat protein [Alistipes sp.]|nr:leucine-rich repeat protein [Alistipes sp.]